MKFIFFFITAFTFVFAQTITKSFQQGKDGYWGAKAVDISSLGYGTSGNINGTTFADGNSDWCIGYLSKTVHAYDIFPLMRFDSLDKYIPKNAEIKSAKLTLTFVQWDKPVRVVGKYLAVDWFADVVDPSGGVGSAQIGWETRKQNVAWGGKGASQSGVDYVANKLFIIPDKENKIPANGSVSYTVLLDNDIVKSWLEPEKNFGFKLETDTVGIHIYVSQPQRHLFGTQPKLTIEYIVPVTTIGKEQKAVNTFTLLQNYPNPFNPTTMIDFTVQISAFTSLKIYDALGREVATLVDEYLESGVHHQQTFDAGNYSSGIYFAKLQSGKYIQLKKMILVK
ncbi:MAG: T9SS type A sorting domain-containing protein [Bacteroidota bacterium]